ncbi:hypothetical protein [Dongia sp.]|uniref:hypothetical protein n=1 Tax=Dongia sp. TaxID=1977262 RepID=UPI0035AF1D75
MNYGLIDPEKLSKGFRYPASFKNSCTVTGETDIKPWSILEMQGDVEVWLEIFREWYPTRSLIPLAQHDVTGDDIACFDGDDRAGDPRVHLSPTLEVALEVGRSKARQPSMLIVAANDAFANGIRYYRGNELIWLADAIPPG